MKQIVIAIDGTTASGKGTVARKLSNRLNLPYLNTGLLYRAVAFKTIENHIENYEDIETISKLARDVKAEDLDNSELSTEAVGGIASKVAPIQEVRNILLDFQKDFAKKGGVLDGRDIGTVICPNADYKFFITATLEARAKRRYKEMIEKGKEASYEDIYNKVKERDERDFNRPIAPLKKADDAVEIDTTDMNPDEVLEYILSYINK